MENNSCKRNLPPRKMSKIIYTFYDDFRIYPQLQILAATLSNVHSCWLIKCYIYDLPITYSKILHLINTPYYKFDKKMDKLCIINNNGVFPKNNTRSTIEYFLNIKHFEQWLQKIKS